MAYSRVVRVDSWRLGPPRPDGGAIWGGRYLIMRKMLLSSGRIARSNVSKALIICQLMFSRKP